MSGKLDLCPKIGSTQHGDLPCILQLRVGPLSTELKVEIVYIKHDEVKIKLKKNPCLNSN